MAYRVVFKRCFVCGGANLRLEGILAPPEVLGHYTDIIAVGKQVFTLFEILIEASQFAVFWEFSA
jgi:hypothetical protein